MSKALNYTYRISPAPGGNELPLTGMIYLQNIRDETAKSPDIQKGGGIHFSFDSTKEPIVGEVDFMNVTSCADFPSSECGHNEAEVNYRQIDKDHYKTDITVPFVKTTTLRPDETIILTFKNEDFSPDVAEGYMKSMEI